MDTQGTSGTDTQTPTNHIDLDAADTQKAFAEAYAAASGKETQVVTPVEVDKVPEVATPELVKTEDTKVVEVTPAVEAQKPTVEVKTYDVPDWAKDLPDTVKERLSEELQQKLFFEHRLKSETGRQSALQKKLFDARRENEQLRAKVIQPQDPAIAAAAKQDQAKTLAEWNALKEADPNLAKAIEARLGIETSQNQSDLQRLKSNIDATVNPLNQHIEQTYVEEQQKLLADAVPNYAEVIGSPVYKRWYERDASPGIRQLASTSVDHNDAITVLRMYSQEAPRIYNEMVQAGELPAPTQQQQQVVPQAVTEQVVDTTHADKVAQARQSKIQAAPVVQNAPNPIAPPQVSSQSWKTPGGQIDLDDPTVRALFESEFKKNQRSR